MDSAYQYVYKILCPSLPPELCRIIIGYLIQNKLNWLKCKLQKMYDTRKYYTLDNGWYGVDPFFEEISYNDAIQLNLTIDVFDELTIMSYNDIFYRFNSDAPSYYSISTSLRGIIMEIYELLYNDELDGKKHKNSNNIFFNFNQYS
jgi:hypothetical protein